MRRTLSLAICAAALTLTGCASAPAPVPPESAPMQLREADFQDNLHNGTATLATESDYEALFSNLAINCSDESATQIANDINQTLAGLKHVNAFETRYTVMQQMTDLLSRLTTRHTCAELGYSALVNPAGS